MASINVDVELDGFSNDEIVTELDYRIHSGNPRHKGLSKRIELMFDIENAIKLPKKISLINKQKIDFLMENLEDIKLEDLEKIKR